MAQSLARVLVHVVFSTKNREPLLVDAFRQQAFGYIAKVGREMGCEVYRVGGMQDHVHLAVGLSRTMAVAEFVKKVKQTSSAWIKRNGGFSGFQWQAGYGVFSIGESQLGALTTYIDRQEEHHRKKTFQDEYRSMLAKCRVDYDEQYLWD